MVALPFSTVTFPASVSIALRKHCRCVSSSVKFVWRAQPSHAVRSPASVTLICFRSVRRLQMRSLRRRPGIVRGTRSGLSTSAFGNCARASFSPGSFAPNKSFKPTPCRGVGHVLYATLAHVRRPATGRLNSGVRAQGELYEA